MSPVLARFVGHKPKRDFTNSCTPCLTLKPEVDCRNTCCRTVLVPIAQEDLDEGLLPQPPFVDVLQRAPSGACAHFETATGRCLAWDRRPLVCRTYDCRDDSRFSILRLLPDSRIEAPAACHLCGRPLEVLLGVREVCDGHVVCIHCGAGLRVQTIARPDCNVMRLEPANVPAEVQRRYLFRAHTHREQWEAALAMGLAEPRDEAILLAETGRNEEARTLLTPLAAMSPRAALDLAWVETRLGDDESAKARVLRTMPLLPGPLMVRAHLLLANIARRRAEVQSVALHAVLALQRDRAVGGRNAVLKEYVQELLHGSPEAARAVESAVLALLRA